MFSVVLLLFFGGTNTLATSFDLGGVMSGNRMAGVPLGLSLGDGELDVEGICQTSGMACLNCTHAVTCIALPVGWLKVPLQVCPDGETCNAQEGKCSSHHVPECEIDAQKYKHTCEQVGIFPDAYDCRKFHLCSPPEGLPDGRPADHRTALCPRHYGYNPQNAQCSLKLNHGQCSQKPVAVCTRVGQNGVLLSSPNHYYVCLSKHGQLYPQVFLCPNGWYFYDGFCKPEPKKEPSTKVQTIDAEKATIKVDHEASTTTERTTTLKVNSFFSTEKAVTYKADTFLADKFDLTNYETTDDVVPSNSYEFTNSFETGGEFW